MSLEGQEQVQESNEGNENQQKAFRDAVEVQVLSMVADGKLTEEEAEEKRKTADLITDGIPEDVAHAAKTFVMAGVASESETLAHFDAERASVEGENDDEAIESTPAAALYKSSIEKGEQARALSDTFTAKLEANNFQLNEEIIELKEQFQLLQEEARKDLDAWFAMTESSLKTHEEEIESMK